MPTFRARLVFPVDGPPIAEGVLQVEAGKIVHLGDRALHDCLDLGNVALLPGLVNAHTHLEFSDREQPLGEPGIGLPAWIQRLVEERREQAERNPDAGRLAGAIHRGLQESRGYGVAAIGEIATSDEDAYARTDSEGRLVLFREILGMAPERQAELLTLAQDFASRPRSPGRDVGLSPHAPYTVSLPLLHELCTVARRNRCPIAMHLAESREELEMLQNHAGPLVDTLRQLQAWYPQSLTAGTTILDYLRELSQVERALVVHGNYLTDTEIAFLGQHRHLSVIYCPRTHAFFGHQRYPLPRLLAGSVRVALGTDSRASNPDLSILREMIHVRRTFPELDDSTLLKMGTLWGAEALGLEDHLGSLTPGKEARLTCVALPEQRAADPYALLWRATDCRLLDVLLRE